MDPAGIKPYLDVLTTYGIPLVVTFGVFVLLWRFIPKWIESSIEVNRRVPEELSQLNQTLKGGSKDIHQLKRALQHGARAAALALRREDTAPGVTSEIANMLKCLGEDDDGRA